LDYAKHFQDINERMRHLKCYYPFFRIYAYSSRNNLEYDLPYIALSVLILLIEKGKLRGRSVKVDEIEEHVKSMLDEMYPYHQMDSKQVTYVVLNALETDRDGESYLFEHIDPVRRKKDGHYVHLIEYDVNNKAYQISDAGLDFMISIKELPEESKISVSLILFKKQIENGSFITALNTVRELNLEVLRKKEKRQYLLEKMLYGGPDVVEDYSIFSEGVFSQLQQEKILFDEVRTTLFELTKNHEEIINVSNKKENEKEFLILKQISTEIDRGYLLHSGLLKDYTDLPGEYERICRIRVNSLFDRKWHFKEVLENNVQLNYPNEVHIIGMHPIFLPKSPKSFSLYKIFEPQIVSRKKPEISETRQKDEWSERKLIDDTVDERQRNNFRIYAHLLLECVEKHGGDSTLESYLETVEDALGSEALQNIDLIPFLFSLNIDVDDLDGHASKNSQSSKKKEVNVTLFDFNKLKSSSHSSRELILEALILAHNTLGLSSSNFIVTSFPDETVSIEKGFRAYISNMKFMMK